LHLQVVQRATSAEQDVVNEYRQVLLLRLFIVWANVEAINSYGGDYARQPYNLAPSEASYHSKICCVEHPFGFSRVTAIVGLFSQRLPRRRRSTRRRTQTPPLMSRSIKWKYFWSSIFCCLIVSFYCATS
jgi:hypothetical protein